MVEGSYDIGRNSVSVIIETDVGKILFSCLYRSASFNDSQNNEFLEYFSTKISLSEEEDIETVILGYFNCPEFSWLSGNVIGP